MSDTTKRKVNSPKLLSRKSSLSISVGSERSPSPPTRLRSVYLRTPSKLSFDDLLKQDIDKSLTLQSDNIIGTNNNNSATTTSNNSTNNDPRNSPETINNNNYTSKWVSVKPRGLIKFKQQIINNRTKNNNNQSNELSQTTTNTNINTENNNNSTTTSTTNNLSTMSQKILSTPSFRPISIESFKHVFSLDRQIETTDYPPPPHPRFIHSEVGSPDQYTIDTSKSISTSKLLSMDVDMDPKISTPQSTSLTPAIVSSFYNPTLLSIGSSPSISNYLPITENNNNNQNNTNQNNNDNNNNNHLDLIPSPTLNLNQISLPPQQQQKLINTQSNMNNKNIKNNGNIISPRKNEIKQIVSPPSSYSALQHSLQRKQSSMQLLQQQKQQQQKSQQQQQTFALVLYKYEADEKEELELIKDSYIIVTEQCSDGWWKGETLDSTKRGIFPNNYVKIINNLPPSLILPSPRNNNDQNQNSEMNSSLNQENLEDLILAASTVSNSQLLSIDTMGNSIKSPSNLHNQQFTFEDPNIFFGKEGSLNNSSYKGKMSKYTSIKTHKKNIILLKIYIPPFNEHTIIQFNQNDTLKEALDKIGRKKKILIMDLKHVHFKLWNGLETSSPLSLNTIISTISEPDRGIRLFIDGFDYINQLPNTIRMKSNQQQQQQQIVDDKLQQSKYQNMYLQNYFIVSCCGEVRHWVILDNNSIQIYKSYTELTPIRIISFKLSTIKLLTNTKKAAFQLKTPFQSIKFFSESLQIVNQWIQAIESSKEYRENNIFYRKKQRKLLVKSNSERSLLSMDDMRSSCGSPPPIDRKQQMTLIRNRHSNNYCADCTALSPEWANIGLGIFLCDDCSQIHQRQLSAQLSDVISVILDEFIDTHHINIFDKVGNEISNSYWEYQLNNMKKVNSNSYLHEKEEFIIAKYKKKEFIPIDQSIHPPNYLI